jgi:hypothetical protein
MAGSTTLKNALVALLLLGLVTMAVPPIGDWHARLRTALANGLSTVGLCQPQWKLFAPNVHKLNSRIAAEVVLVDGSVLHWISPDFADRSALQKLTQGQLPKFYDNLRRDRNHAAWRSFATWVAREVAPGRNVRLVRLERRYAEIPAPLSEAPLPRRNEHAQFRSHVFYEVRFQ